MEGEFKRSLDIVASVKTFTLVIRQRKDWFDEEASDQKRKVRREERKWIKYREQKQWRIYCHERNRYNYMISEKKTKLLSDKIMMCKGNTKELYKTFNKIIGLKSEDQMPEGKSEDQLATEFAEFFTNKIQKIRDELKENPKYVPKKNHSISGFSKFKMLTQEDVGKLIKGISTKCCELDAMSTNILKNGTILKKILPVITKLINLPLQQGVFAKEWKTSIVRPTLKKIGLEVLLNNYRPESNLSFLSKLREKAALVQLMEHCCSNALLPDYQSAYREGYSCETAIDCKEHRY